MKYFKSSQLGRVFILRMERGDLLLETVADLCKTENIQNAILSSGIATFDAVHMQMTNTDGYPIGYHVHCLQEPLELGALDGTIIDGLPHLHGVVSNSQRTWAGHLLDHCRILYLGEIVIQEILVDLVRKPDENGVMLIHEKES